MNQTFIHSRFQSPHSHVSVAVGQIPAYPLRQPFNETAFMSPLLPPPPTF